MSGGAHCLASAQCQLATPCHQFRSGGRPFPRPMPRLQVTRCSKEENSKPAASRSKSSPPSSGGSPPSSLAFPSNNLSPDGNRSLSSSGLQRTSLSGGVQNATLRCDLPSPAVAVRNLVEQAQHAHLCTLMSAMHHRRAGYPFGTVVEFAADGAGHPLFSLSPLAIHTRNIREDARCSLVLQLPGWTGLANARVTIFGDVYPLPSDMQEAAREIFHQKHASHAGDPAKKSSRWLSGNAQYFRMHHLRDIYFVGGFGTVQWVDAGEYAAATPDAIVLHGPTAVLRVLNERFAGALRGLFGARGGGVDDAVVISIDKLGADVRVRRAGQHAVERLVFDQEVVTLEDAIDIMQRLTAHVEV
ncbi:CPL8 [Auxenochlorella protothecoides x Auxenochlorella symbiontica]